MANFLPSFPFITHTCVTSSRTPSLPIPHVDTGHSHLADPNIAPTHPLTPPNLTLQAFKGSDTAAYAGARWFCGHVLLAERRPPPPATQPAGTDGQAVGSVAAGTRDGRGAEEAGGRVGAGAAAPKACAPGGELGRVVVVKTEEEGGGAGGADAGAGAMQATAGAVGEQPQQSEPMQQQQQQSQCLAGEILSQLPDTQQWLRQAISAIMKGGQWEIRVGHRGRGRGRRSANRRSRSLASP